MYTKSLAEAGGASFTALSVHPGVFQTRLLPIYGRVGRPAEEAAPILTTLGFTYAIPWSTVATTTV